MTGVWLLPTRNKLDNLRRFLNAAREMGSELPMWILINEDEWLEKQAEYEVLSRLLPNGYVYKPVKAKGYGEALRAVWDEVKNMDWVGLVADDLVPSTSNWDKHLVSSLLGWNFVSSNDGWQAPNRMHGATVFSGPLLRAVGWLFPPGLKHVFHDNVWETLAQETGSWKTRMDVLCKHLHESLEGIKGPTMDPNSDLWKHDQKWFENWLQTDMPNVAQRIRVLIEAHGVRTMKPDFTGMRLMIATPTVDGKYESQFQQSFFNTMRLLHQNNVFCCLAEEKYTADIALARSKLFASFMRSDCTHLLMVDADMGWGEDAIMRLVCAKKDFVAIPGPKKRYPLQFAANFTDDQGNPIPLTFDHDSGTMEIGEIGMAFCLISRRCAEKMIQSYSELEYLGVTGEKEWGVFIPMVLSNRWYSEDFAFCKRWRMLGERCYMIPDVKLTHTGFHTFEGAFSETIKTQ